MYKNLVGFGMKYETNEEMNKKLWEGLRWLAKESYGIRKKKKQRRKKGS